MRQGKNLKHEFVEFIPDVVEEGTLYVSMEYATVVHKCCCGCGKEVVTPLSPTDWKLIFDGKTISLDPSVGNWGFECHSHYWIRNNRVRWAAQWSPEKIAAGRAQDRLAKDRYFGTSTSAADAAAKAASGTVEGRKERGFWHCLKVNTIRDRVRHSPKCSIAPLVVRMASCAVTFRVSQEAARQQASYAINGYRAQLIAIVLIQTQAVTLHRTRRKASSGLGE